MRSKMMISNFMNNSGVKFAIEDEQGMFSKDNIYNTLKELKEFIRTTELGKAQSDSIFSVFQKIFNNKLAVSKFKLADTIVGKSNISNILYVLDGINVKVSIHDNINTVVKIRINNIFTVVFNKGNMEADELCTIETHEEYLSSMQDKLYGCDYLLFMLTFIYYRNYKISI